MKLFHLSDLHLGKRLNELPLLEDQKYILSQIIEMVRAEQPKAVLIAGDVYDRAQPPAEAVALFDEFITTLSAMGVHVLIISGNHDSAERIAYGGKLFSQAGIHVSPVYSGSIHPVELKDEFGPVRFYLLPYLHPVSVARLLPESNVTGFDDATAAVVSTMKIDPSVRNVLLAHQFVVGGSVSDSERQIGTLDQVDAHHFDAFDYVALGHLHRPQNVAREDGTMRYCGTPLKYSLSEVQDEKSVTVVELNEKGSVTIRLLPLKAPHEMRTLSGQFELLLSNGPEAGAEEDYYYITLTDTTDVPNAAARLRKVYPNLMSLTYNNGRSRFIELSSQEEKLESSTDLQLLSEFYALQNGGRSMDEQTLALATELLLKSGGTIE